MIEHLLSAHCGRKEPRTKSALLACPSSAMSPMSDMSPLISTLLIVLAVNQVKTRFPPVYEITTLSCMQVDAGFIPQAPPGPKQTQPTESGPQAGPKGRILGGSDAAAGEFPAHVSLHVGVSVLQQFICSGSIKYPP